jgi:hypothetical protein
MIDPARQLADVLAKSETARIAKRTGARPRLAKSAITRKLNGTTHASFAFMVAHPISAKSWRRRASKRARWRGARVVGTAAIST